MNEENSELFSELHNLSAYLRENNDKKAQEVVDEAILKIDDYELLIEQLVLALKNKNQIKDALEFAEKEGF